jgi:glyoxylase-like metal-dependent hydrolase (beta-lactamase superfamily II)
MNLLETRGPHTFGPWTVIQIVEWEGEAFPYTVLFPNIPIEQVRAASPAGSNSRITENGMLITSSQLFILRQAEQVILIEQGTGNGKTRPDEPYWDHQNLPYLETLASLGIRPEDVDYVFLSHLHVDHVGLATTQQADYWVPTFPRAKYVLHPDEWAYWGNLPGSDPLRHPCIDDSVLPLVEAGCIQWAHSGDLIGGVRIHAAPGHTPGNLLFEVEEYNLWFIGDLLHHPAQVMHPEWASASFDVDRATNLIQRKNFIERFAASEAVLFSVHMGNPFQVIRTGASRSVIRYQS